MIEYNRVECLWVRIREKANEADVMVGVLLQTTQQGQRGNEIFYRQLEEISQRPALALVGDFNLPDVCRKHSREELSRRLLEHMKGNCLTQLVKETTREGAPLDLLFVNREGFVGDVIVGGCSGYSNCKILFSILRGGTKGNSRTAVMDFLRADFHPFRRLVDRVPWKAILKGKGPR